MVPPMAVVSGQGPGALTTECGQGDTVARSRRASRVHSGHPRHRTAHLQVSPPTAWGEGARRGSLAAEGPEAGSWRRAPPSFCPLPLSLLSFFLSPSSPLPSFPTTADTPQAPSPQSSSLISSYKILTPKPPTCQDKAGVKGHHTAQARALPSVPWRPCCIILGLPGGQTGLCPCSLMSTWVSVRALIYTVEKSQPATISG